MDQFEKMVHSFLPATVADDEPLMESNAARAVAHARALLAKYPNHPILLMYLSNYTCDPAEEVNCLRQAIEAANRHGWVTYPYQIDLAGALIGYHVDYLGAKEQLDTARDEVKAADDEDYLWLFEQHSDELQTIKNGRRCKCGYLLKNLSSPRCPNCNDYWGLDE